MRSNPDAPDNRGLPEKPAKNYEFWHQSAKRFLSQGEPCILSLIRGSYGLSALVATACDNEERNMAQNASNLSRREFLHTSAGAAALVVAGCDWSGGNRRNSDQESALMAERPIHYQTLVDVAAQIRDGALNSVEVTEALLNRVNRLQPNLHAYITVIDERALERAAAADHYRDNGGELGPLHGVPIAVKDLCHMRGTPTTGGHSFRSDVVSDHDATVVARLEVPRNPWGELDRWPGVSSGGSGVAPAAGLCFAAIGTDTGGSIRFPSAANGIVGLKPTWGRVSRYGVLDLAPTLDHVGPMTRSVQDAARVLQSIAGSDDQDPTSLPDPVPDYENALARGVDGLRIGWDEAFATTDVESYVADAVREAVVSLEKLGAKIVETSVPALERDEIDAWTTLAGAEAAVVHEATYPSRATEYGKYFEQFLSSAHALTPLQLAKAVIARKRAAGRMAPLFQSIDVLVCPTLASESFSYDPSSAYEGIDQELGMLAGVPLSFFERSGRFITVWDYNGYPTLSLPCGFSPDGIPLSLQLVGAPLSEATLCRAGYAYEQAHEFHRQHPVLG
jgi:amidase